MHQHSEEAVQEFLLKAHKTLDPIERLEMLEGSEFGDDPGVKAARAWWDARFCFADKKQTRVSDKFLWFLLVLKTWESSPNSSGKKQVIAMYNEAFLSPETERAISLEDRLEDEILSACALYVSTITPDPGFLGFRAGKTLKPDGVRRRISGIVAGGLLPAVCKVCAGLDHAGALIRCLWKGAEEIYPDISANLEEVVEKYDDAQMRDFVLRALGRD